jgi:pyruvate-formate lyase-activating enzyme
MDQKKCPHCGNWSSWNLSLTDICEHCGKTLGGRDLENQEKRQADKKTNEDNWMFNIKDSDSDFKKGLKKVGNFSYTIFMAIISFILWLIAALPG